MTITVGFDGSDESRYAATFAANEARLRKTSLRIMYSALTPLSGGRYYAASGWQPQDAIPAAAWDMVEEAAETIRNRVPDVDVNATVVESMTVAGSLIDQSRRSELLVLGRRGRGGFTGLLLGSTSAQVTSHAHCPVVVTRHAPDTDPAPYEQIVVGVDDSPLSQSALRFAFEEAQWYGADLVAVHAWQFEIPAIEIGAVAYTFDHKQAEDEARARLGQVLAGWREQYPDVTVIPTLRYGDPRQPLLDISERARMVVVASRGRGGFAFDPGVDEPRRVAAREGPRGRGKPERVRRRRMRCDGVFV